MASTTKARQFGFADRLETEDMFLDMLKQMRDEKIIPSY